MDEFGGGRSPFKRLAANRRVSIIIIDNFKVYGSV